MKKQKRKMIIIIILISLTSLENSQANETWKLIKSNQKRQRIIMTTYENKQIFSNYLHLEEGTTKRI